MDLEKSKYTTEVNDLKRFEAQLCRKWEAGKIRCPLHLSGGNEVMLINMFKDIKRDDYVFSTHRNHYHYLLHGGSWRKLYREIRRNQYGVCKGQSGSMYTIDREKNFFASAIVGGVCAIAVGVGWALKQKAASQHVWVFVGDGCEDTGHMYEAVRYAEGWELPVTFIIEDNDRSTCTTKRERWGDKDMRLLRFSRKVKGYMYKASWPHVGSGKYVAF